MIRPRFSFHHTGFWMTFLTGILLISLPCETVAQEKNVSDDKNSERPRIGVCLGGGGARGAAHIGVLQVLKEMNVPIDYVVGTSMGSIVGALYAVGMDPDEIEAIVVGVDWDDLFSDRPERTQRIYRRKQDDSAAFIPLEWGWKKGMVLSSAIVAGQKLSFAFRSPALYLSGHHGFDDLPYPYRAVTTDLQTGEMFVPEEGNLLKAVRASMSIPGVFPPVNWGDGKRLVDGYLARNLPVDVVRSLGADIVIAVDVGSLPEDTPQEDLQTLGGINAQKGIIGARQNVDPQLKNADIVIQPDLTGISTRDFKRVGDTVEPGRKATREVADQLAELALDPDAYQEHLLAHAPRPTPALIIDRITLVNNTRVKDQAIMSQIHQAIGSELDLDQLKFDLAKIYDFGVFELVDFELDFNDGELELVITASEKYHSPNIINFGLSYEGGEGGRSDIEARMRITRMEMNRFGAELRTDIQFGVRNLLQMEFYQPLTWARRPFVALTGLIEHNVHDWYYELVKWGQYKTIQQTIRPEAGIRIGHYGEIRGGLEYGYLKASDRTGLSLAEFDGNRGGYTASLRFDMFDLPYLPHKGYSLKIDYFDGRPQFGSDLDYTRLEGRFATAHTFSSHTILLGVGGGSNLNTDLPEFHMFTLGGLGRLSGYAKDQLRGQAYGLGKIAWYHQFAGSPSPYSTSYYFGLSFEAGNTWYDPGQARWDDLRYSALATAVAMTNLGPLALTYGRAEDGHDNIYLTLGTMNDFLD